MISGVQEGLCNFTWKEYFDILHFIICIHRNSKILAFIFQNISNNHDQNCGTSVKNVQHLAKLVLLKQKVTLITLLKKKSVKNPNIYPGILFVVAFCTRFWANFLERCWDFFNLQSSLKFWIFLIHFQYVIT